MNKPKKKKKKKKRRKRKRKQKISKVKGHWKNMNLFLYEFSKKFTAITREIQKTQKILM